MGEMEDLIKTINKRAKMTQRDFMQEQWDNWGDKQFTYMKGWAYLLSKEILNDSKCVFFERDILKVMSILMKSMMKDYERQN